MLARLLSWFLLLAASGVLTVGCRGIHSTAAGGSETGASRTRSGSAGVSEADLVEAHAHYGAGIVHEMNGEQDLALEEYFQAALKDPQDAELVMDVSRRLLQSGQPQKAMELLVDAADQPDAPAVLDARLGFVYSALGKSAAAIRAEEKAIRKQPELLLGYQNLFVHYLKNNRPKEAFKTLNRAAAVRHTDAAFLIGLGELYANLGLQVPALKSAAYKASFTAFQRAEKLHPDDPQLRLRLADGLNLLGKDAGAARIYTDLLKQLPDMPLVRENIRGKLADIYLRGPDHKLAAEQLQDMIQDDPTDVQAYYLLGRLAYDDKRYADAAGYLSKTVQLNPDYEPAYYDLADAQISADRNADALATLDKARQRFQQNFTIEYLSGLACTRMKDYTNAISHFNTAEIISRTSSTNRLSELLSIFYFQFGAACERAGEYSRAEENFEKCLHLAPDSGEALNYLGFMWADRGVKLDQARDLIARALKVEPDNPAYLDSMGWVLFKLHSPREALDYILKAIKFSKEEDSVLYDHLGDVYAALGRQDQARAAWRKSLSLEANDQVRRKLEPAATR